MSLEKGRIMTQTEAILDKVRAVYPEGIPNLYRTLMGNSAVLSGWVALDGALAADGVLAQVERMTVGILTAQHFDCSYCHSALVKEAQDAGGCPDDIRAVNDKRPPNDRRLRMLTLATQRILETSGRLPRAEILHYARHGLDEAALLEIIAVVGEFTIATHANNLLRTRIDPEYRAAIAPTAQD